MAIYAQKTTFRSSGQNPDFYFEAVPDNGDVLVYDELKKAFVNKPQSSLSGVQSSGGGGSSSSGGSGVSTFTNLGVGSRIFKQLTSNTAEIRSLVSGNGISILQGQNEIEITNKILSDAYISVPNSFGIEIDNDNTTGSSAKFELFTNRIKSSAIFTPIIYNAVAFDITVVADTNSILKGKFISNTHNFTTLGFQPGMSLKVTGTNEQDGIWKIDSIITTTRTNDTLVITVPFPNATDTGQQPPVIFRGMFLEFLNNLSLKVANHNFTVDGFLPGQTITILGTTDNDGTYIINSISPVGDVITLNAAGGSFPGTIGPDIGSVSISTAAVGTVSTGWWVNERGEMNANATTIAGDLIVNHGGDLSVDGDLFIGGHSLQTLINNSFPVFPDNGFIVQRASNDFVGRSITAGSGLNVTNSDGISGNPHITADNFRITLTGDVSGYNIVTGLTDVSITANLANITAAGTYNTVTIDTKGRVVNGVNYSYQPANPVLGVLAGGPTSPGYIIWDGSSYVSRFIQGITNQIAVYDGDANAGGTRIGLVDNPIIPGNAGLTIPVGLSNQRPVVPTNGTIRYNTSLQIFEGYRSGNWEQFNTNLSVGAYLPLAGGIMTGTLTLNDNDLVFTTGKVDGRDVSADGTVLDNINTGVGVKVQTAPDTFVNRTIAVQPDTGLNIINDNGVSGDPTLGFSINAIPELLPGVVVDEYRDYLVLYDTSEQKMVKTIVHNINNRDAFRYFMGQF